MMQGGVGDQSHGLLSAERDERRQLAPELVDPDFRSALLLLVFDEEPDGFGDGLTASARALGGELLGFALRFFP